MKRRTCTRAGYSGCRFSPSDAIGEIDQLRRWLDVVEDGHEVTITERGKPVARLIGVSSPSQLERLIADGVVTPAKRGRRLDRAHRKVKARGTVSDLVAGQRR